jgi:hypothetical protein
LHTISNDVRSEAGFPDLVRFILGDTGVPYDWEYGDHAGEFPVVVAGSKAFTLRPKSLKLRPRHFEHN